MVGKLLAPRKTDLCGVAIIPAFNESATIEKIVKYTKKELNDLFQHNAVIVVDDGSTDGTAAKAKLADALVIKLKKNNGVSHTFAVGKAFARKLKPDVVVQLDADGQHVPRDIPRLVQPILKETADYVVGSRFLEEGFGFYAENQYKRLGNHMFSVLLSLLLKSKFTDAQSGFRSWRFPLLQESQITSRYTYVHETLIKAKRNGGKIAEIPIRANKRRFGDSKVVKNNFVYGFLAIRDISKAYCDVKKIPFLFLPFFQLFLLSVSFWIMIWIQVKRKLKLEVKFLAKKKRANSMSL